MTAIPTSWISCSRFCATTTISSMAGDAAGGACATAMNGAAGANVDSRTRRCVPIVLPSSGASTTLMVRAVRPGVNGRFWPALAIVSFGLRHSPHVRSTGRSRPRLLRRGGHARRGAAAADRRGLGLGSGAGIRRHRLDLRDRLRRGAACLGRRLARSRARGSRAALFRAHAAAATHRRAVPHAATYSGASELPQRLHPRHGRRVLSIPRGVRAIRGVHGHPRVLRRRREQHGRLPARLSRVPPAGALTARRAVDRSTSAARSSGITSTSAW